MSVPKVKLALQPVPKSLLRITVAGEFLKNMGLTNDQDIRNIQQAVAEGLVEQLVVVGVDRANIGRERFILKFAPLGSDDIVHLELSDGKSTMEALDTGFAGAVAYSVQLMQRRALTPRFLIIWSVQARTNPDQLAAACRRLNLIMDVPQPTYSPDLPSMPPPIPPPLPPTAQSGSSSLLQWLTGLPAAPSGQSYKPMVTITPGKDPGMSYTIEKLIKRT